MSEIPKLKQEAIDKHFKDGTTEQEIKQVLAKALEVLASFYEVAEESVEKPDKVLGALGFYIESTVRGFNIQVTPQKVGDFEKVLAQYDKEYDSNDVHTIDKLTGEEVARERKPADDDNLS